MYIPKPNPLLKRLFTTTTPRNHQVSIPTTYYRGGTSRALLFNETHLPSNKSAWNPIFLSAMGSPDPQHGRQLNGMGGGISSLSKVCVVRKSARNDAEAEFTFGQVGIRDSGVDYQGNCGNVSAAVGPFVVEEGIVATSRDTSTSTSTSLASKGKATRTVKLFNTNTQKHIESTFPITESGMPDLSGAFAIDGVSGTAAKIKLDFIDPAGSKTGSLLPTGSVVDVIQDVRVSCVDAGNPCVFVRASDPALRLDEMVLRQLGKKYLSDIRPEDLGSCPEFLEKLENIRQHATVKMGMAKSIEEVPPSVPKICIVDSSPGEDVDVIVRAISTQQPHKALPITAGLALSAAARLAGSVVNECLRTGDSAGQKDGITIGHPSGKLDVGAEYVDGKLTRTTVYRTARRLMRGDVFVD